MLFGVEFHRQGPPVWKVITVNLKPTRVERLRAALMSITALQPTAAAAEEGEGIRPEVS